MNRKVEIVTKVDFNRLSALLKERPASHDDCFDLEEKLDRATVVEPRDAPADLVTMNSTIVATTMSPTSRSSKQGGTISLVYPHAANISDGHISVYAPLGSALLGARAGQIVSWRGIDGVDRELRVDRVVYQPESSGDWHL